MLRRYRGRAVRLLPLLVSLFAVATLNATGCASISGLDDLEVGCDGSSCGSSTDGGGEGGGGDGATGTGDGSGPDASNDASGSKDTALADGCVVCGGSTCCAPKACVQATCCNDVGASCSGAGNGGCCAHSYCPSGGGVCTACKQQQAACASPSECCTGVCIANKCGDN
jgi:hypothetical protein